MHLHAGPSFADVVAPTLGIALLEAPADWLALLPRALTRRDVRAMPIGDAYRLRRPAFVKSPNDKSISALVYADGSRLPGPDAVDPATVVLVSDVMTFAVEYRLHVLDGAVRTAGQYAEGRGSGSDRRTVTRSPSGGTSSRPPGRACPPRSSSTSAGTRRAAGR